MPLQKQNENSLKKESIQERPKRVRQPLLSEVRLLNSEHKKIDQKSH